jgi:hypothetical protein
MMMKDPLGAKKKKPFAFALEELDALSPMIKQMFGGFVRKRPQSHTKKHRGKEKIFVSLRVT